jgi:hypothetical protein
MLISDASFVFIITFLFNGKTQDKADRAGDHPLLVCMNDADAYPAGCGGNHASGTAVSE